MIILDTSVVCELARATPAPEVLAWLQQTPAPSFAITAVTMAEIESGIARLPTGARQTRLQATVGRLFQRYSSFVLPFDDAAARAYGSVLVKRERLGRPIGGLDAQIVSIALSRPAQLATRNVNVFLDTGVELVNPWNPDPGPARPPV